MRNEVLLKDLINELEQSYPLHLAEDWDKVGLHFGNANGPIHKILVALDIRQSVIEEAIANQVDTIIVHHPPIFNPIERFDMENPMIQTFSHLIKNDINVYAMHTNLDIATNGMNDWLTKNLNLVNIRSFDPNNLENPSLGRIGDLELALTRSELIQHIKSSLQVNQLTVIEKNPKDYYQTIAVIGGAGMSLIESVAEAVPDVFITGDISYHQGHVAEDLPFMTIDAGHYIEVIFIEKMTQELKNLVHSKSWQINIIASQANTNPFKYE